MIAYDLADQVCIRLQIPTPTSFQTSPLDNHTKFIKALIDSTCQELRDMYDWPELQREWTFTLATGTASYALPADFNRFITNTWWNRTETEPLVGPTDPVEWQILKSGSITSFPDTRFRVKYWNSTQLFIDPTPTSAENGQTIAFEYISNNVFKPLTWTASTSIAIHRYIQYNGNVYDRGATGAATTGTTPPTHTSGAASDGTISWTYSFLDTVQVDGTIPVLDNQLVIDEIIWRYKREKGLDFAAFKDAADRRREAKFGSLGGSGSVSVRGAASNAPDFIGTWNYPEGNF